MPVGALWWVNVAIAFLAVTFWTGSLVHRWHTMTGRGKRIGCAVDALLVVITYGSGEAAHDGVHVAPRVVATTVALLLLVAALSYRFRDHEHRPPI